MVAALTGCPRTTGAYIPVSVAGGLAFGLVYGNEGAAGALAGGALVVGAIAMVLCIRLEWVDMLRSATAKANDVQRGLNKLREEINGR
jgi:hypothetical protein